MDKMKTQDMQLMQTSGIQQALSMIRAQSQEQLLQPMAQTAKAQPVKRQTDHLGRACRSTRVEPFIPTAIHKPTNTCTQLDPPQYMFIDQYLL